MKKTIKDKLQNIQWSIEQIEGWCKTIDIKIKLIRHYFPFQMELDKVSIQDTLLVINKLNVRPKKIGF